MEREQGYRSGYGALSSLRAECRRSMMHVRRDPLFGPADADRGGAVVTVAVLEEGSGLAQLLAGAAGLAVRPAGRLDELLTLAETGDVEAAVVDPEFGEGWPAPAAAEAAEQLGGRVPLVLVCRSALDAAAIQAQTTGAAAVLVRDRLSAGTLAAVLIGQVAQRRAAPRPTRLA